MTKIITRYILSRLFNIMIFVLLAGIAVFIAVDLIENLDEFIDSGVAWSYIFRYYLYFAPYVMYLILPVTLLLSTLFSLGSMSNRNEITAMKASGVSVYRMLMIVAIPAFLLSVTLLVFGETLVPYFNKKRMDIYREQVKKVPPSSASRRGRIYFVENNRIIHINHFNGETASAFDVDIMNIQGNEIVSRMDADQMIYRKNHWIIYNCVFRDFIGDSVDVRYESMCENREFKFTPADLLKIQAEPEEMNYWELKDFIQQLRETGADALRWRVELEEKLAPPFAAFIIVIFGVPIAVVKRRSGLMVGFGISLLVAFLYFGSTKSTLVLGYKGLIDPFLAAWSGHILFGILGIIAVLKVRK